MRERENAAKIVVEEAATEIRYGAETEVEERDRA